MTRTDFAKPLYEDADVESYLNRVTPLRRIVEPQDIAGAAIFFASGAGVHVIGQALVIDGGRSIDSDI